ncbi:hypothetical protein Dsin_025125 [Dipteronia sinensis]|uniref:Ubiquitin-like protease family profile domain-containing protein n=1 Tax=Dipteronia sinensis TaxID=43782 RepID=A0AAE0DWI2_9ROSI|nr:hypothetical protein Dsin_025125 [Dipteronia sinensis]
MLRKIFKGKRPTAEVLYATLKKMSSEESEDAYKMLNIYMDVLNKRLPKLRGEEEKEDKKGKIKKNKKIIEEEEALEEEEEEVLEEEEEEEEEDKKKKNKNKNRKSVEEQEVKGKGKGKGKGRLQGEEEKKKKKSKYYTYNLSGFPLALQVWAVERVISLENLVGKRVATGYPQFSRWEFSAKTALFDWDVETFENGKDYFKSLNLEYVCGPLIDKKWENLALPRSEEEEDLGSDHEGDDNQTGNDNDGIDCSVQKKEIGGSVGITRSTFSNEYSPLLRSDYSPIEIQRYDCIYTDCFEYAIVNGAEQADDVVDDKGVGNNVTVVKDVEELNSVGEVGERGKDVQQDGDTVAEVRKGGEEDDAFGDVDAAFQGGKGEEKDDDVGDVNAAFEGCKSDEQEDSVGENGKGSKQGVGSDGLVVGDVAFEGGKGDKQDDDVGEIGKGSKEGVGSDCVVVTDAAFEGGKGDDQEDAAVGEIGMGCDQGVGSDGVVVGDAAFEGDMVETNLNIKWAIEMDTLEAMRKIEKFEKAEKERRQQTETEFVPLNYQPSPDILRHVTGHDLLYPQPWWEMDSVLIPCHLTGYCVLCHILFKEGKVLLFDSLNERDGTSHRLKDVCALLYLFPSLLKHAGYYEEMKIDPHASPFTVQSMGSELIPQQDDRYSCGIFLMKYAELILAGVKTPWKSVFEQKDVKDIPKAIAIDIYTNGQPCNSP